ncbi:response regulator [Capilliphycus salinus ALCB114379]|uniref:response regulator n=1 Tax=Capilliphycus salinus TaxID=2768948 RepID=UPI0039A6E5DF
MTDSGKPLDQVETPKILVVDDLPENLHLLQRILTKQGYEVRLVTSGKLALSSLSRFQPDLILLDIMMPPNEWLCRLRTVKSESRNPEHSGDFY